MKKKKQGAPSVIRIKKAGWIYIALCIFMGVGAVNTANNLVYIIVALMLGFMAVSGFFGVADMNRLRVEISLPDEIYAGRVCPVNVRLVNERRFLPAFLIRIHVRGQELLFPFTDTGGETVKFAETVFGSRGRHSIGGMYVSTVFPFNFFVRYKDLSNSADVIVFPAPVPCSSGFSDSKSGGQGERETDRKGFDSELMSIRNYSAGDSMRMIHWKATARTGSLKVKEVAALGAEPVIIDPDKFGGGTEQRLSCAVWLINSLMDKGAPVGLKTAEKLYPPDVTTPHRLKMLRELALYD
ncbi:DUF58 domain-containing protein [Geovibrio thiophilus]|uniref:DUF58 domain-containing protein n=1 Tax=Geovibrio thiophilus TaxID=139438 RepID=A0A410JXS0_9BACT|nr:DUF58 domain-containing protein [Geovibrio thiophilus]QAR32841.1 DUF58 domain-containing protein [Geovibrio thiophilus]